MSTGPIVSAMQLARGATIKRRPFAGALTQPVQMLLRKEKDEEWCAQNLDWLEHLGLQQIRRNAKRLQRNYKLAAGIIDKNDYLPAQDHEETELIELLTKEDEGAFELKFFPIIPNIINVLTGEFQKRTDKITYRATDDISYNERLDEKYSLVLQTMMQQAEQQMLQSLMGQDLDMEDPEVQAQVQQQLSPENLQSLPQIEQYMQKSWKSQYEQWATHQHNADVERFHMEELETEAFKDMLIADREFWHFKMGEDDYEVELWNTMLTFYHKSPHTKYISQGNYVGQIQLMSVADVIDTRGWKMTKEQIESLQQYHSAQSVQYLMPGEQNMYDSSQSYESQRGENAPSLGMRQFMSAMTMTSRGDDVLSQILNDSEEGLDGNTHMLRLTTAYWKSQMPVGHLVQIMEDGSTMEMIVDETFKITTRPIYDNSVLKGKTRETLVYGQHVDWIWINQSWGGEKLSMNGPRWYGKNNTGLEPIYLDVKPLPFQFKGDHTLYGCKLPVEGCVFSERNTKSSSVVDRLKPSQIGFNMVNNQISDILIDELGTIILLDQNALPRHSMGEDWGRGNLRQAYVAMKDFQMLPLDTQVQNTEAPLNFSHFQSLDLSQTQRLLSRIQLANYFKQQAFELIGVNPERAGAVNSQQSGTAVEQAVNLSYSQTEPLFTQHCQFLMPRVHQQRTDLAQFYQSRKPSVRLSYLTSHDEQVNFELNGTELLGRDISVGVSTKVNTRELMRQMRDLFLNNNTTGASIYDLGNIVRAQSPAELDHALKAAQMKAEQMQAQDQDAQAQIQKQMDDAAAKRQSELLAHEKWELEGEWQNNIDVAEIKGMGFQTPDDNADYMAGVKLMSDEREKQATRELRREEMLNQNAQEQLKLNVTREGLRSRERIADKQVDVARINKNKFDKPAPAAKKK